MGRGRDASVQSRPYNPVPDRGVRGVVGGGVVTVKRRGKRWSVEVYDSSKASRKRYVGTFDTQQEARAAGRVAESEVASRRGRPADTSVADFASRWLHMHPREKESTNVGYAQQTKPFVARFGDLPLRESPSNWR